ncbi:MAG: SulP family inorganic anion transporter [Acidimicrobiales bacterium]
MARTFPVSTSMPGYPKRNGRHDVIAGVTVAALAIPSAMAYAELAGLSPVAGLYALLLPAVAYAFLGSSRQVVVGPEGALSLLVAVSVAPLAAGNASTYAALAAMLGLLVGAIAVVGRVIRLGWVADYFSRSVLVGYLHGVAVVLVCGQLGKLFGVPIAAEDPLPQLKEFFSELDQIHGLTVLVGALSIGVLLLLKWKMPKIPAALLVVAAGIAASAAFDLTDHGVATVGHIPAGLPSFRWPNVGVGKTLDLVPAAAGVFAVGFADAILTARSFAGRNGQHVDANQELLAFGTANVAAGLTQGFPIGASGSRTAVNEQVGGRTQVVGLVAAAVAALVLLFLTQPVSVLPKACLGAVIIVAAIGLIEPDAWRSLAQAGRSQMVIAAVTTAGVVLFGVLEALIIAVLLSIVDVVMRSSKPHDAVLGYVPRLDRWADVSLHPSARVSPGVVVYRLDDRLLFANARYVKGRIREAVAGAPTTTHFVVFDAEGFAGMDASGIEALFQMIDALTKDEIALVVARLKSHQMERFDTTGLATRIGRQRFFPTVAAAVEWCVEEQPAPEGGTA